MSEAAGISRSEPGKPLYKYVYELPYLIRKQVCRFLDVNDDWKELAGAHMGYTVFDILEIENECKRRGSSPCDILLTKWGQQNHSITELFVLLARMEHHPALVSIKSLVDSKYHCLIDQQPATSTGNCKKSYKTSNNNIVSSDDNTTSNNVPLHVKYIEQGIKVQNSDKVQNGPPYQSSETSNESNASNPIIAESAGALLKIPYRELEVATQNWKSEFILGKGGFGVVYKGDWKHTAVAIKKLKKSDGVGSTFEESLRELRHLNACRHDNVLPLYGYSIDGGEPCLVYQLMIGGSLEDRLRCKNNQPPLLWKQRLSIAQGVAKGLQYLHTVSKSPLIHGDIKPGNILLDTCGEPRIGDFGLAREGPNNSEFTHVKVTKAYGTKPYLPNEFLSDYKLSVKVDVYSFGVVLFELTTGLLAFDRSRQERYLKDHVVEFCKDNPTNISGLQDQRLLEIGQSNPELCQKLVIVGIKCVQTRASSRPHMVDVWQELMAINC